MSTRLTKNEFQVRFLRLTPSKNVIHHSYTQMTERNKKKKIEVARNWGGQLWLCESITKINHPYLLLFFSFFCARFVTEDISLRPAKYLCTGLITNVFVLLLISISLFRPLAVIFLSIIYLSYYLHTSTYLSNKCI